MQFVTSVPDEQRDGTFALVRRDGGVRRVDFICCYQRNEVVFSGRC